MSRSSEELSASQVIRKFGKQLNTLPEVGASQRKIASQERTRGGMTWSGFMTGLQQQGSRQSRPAASPEYENNTSETPQRKRVVGQLALTLGGGVLLAGAVAAGIYAYVASDGSLGGPGGMPIEHEQRLDGQPPKTSVQELELLGPATYNILDVVPSELTPPTP